MHYTYIHTTPQGRVFYVGKGTGRRAWRTYGRNKHWHAIVDKYGFEFNILKYWATETEALNHEKQLISELLSLGIKLANATTGGDSPGLISEETRRRMSAAKLGRVTPATTKRKISDSLKGMKRNADFCQKISERQRGENNHMFGTTLNDSHPLRQYIGLSGSNNPKATPVLCVQTGQRFQTLTDAETWLRSKGFLKARKQNICFVAQGKRSFAYGYKWQYIQQGE